jgi:hypothetical protein
MLVSETLKDMESDGLDIIWEEEELSDDISDDDSLWS